MKVVKGIEEMESDQEFFTDVTSVVIAHAVANPGPGFRITVVDIYFELIWTSKMRQHLKKNGSKIDTKSKLDFEGRI